MLAVDIRQGTKDLITGWGASETFAGQPALATAQLNTQIVICFLLKVETWESGFVLAAVMSASSFAARCCLRSSKEWWSGHQVSRV